MLDSVLRLGNTAVEGRLWLAPMAGVTDLPFRVVTAQLGCPFSVTEMVSAKGIYYGGKSIELLQHTPEQGKGLVQIFGREPELMADMAKKLYEEGYAREGIDVNMGCPAPKIVKNGEGSALLQEPELCAKIIGAMSKAIPLPVTVKIRKGFFEGEDVTETLCPMLEDAGAAAIAIHGRTRVQMYSGKADWECIARVRKLVKIPLIGNGDVDSRETAQKRMEETGCDGVLIGRGAFGNPFVFSKERLTDEEKLKVIERHLELSIQYRGEKAAIPLMRKHMCAYLKGYRGAAKAKTEILSACTREAILAPVRRVLLGTIDKE
ncbi:MAG: tRNA dihydrouridine synthase DusB [Clostridiales bacterium]|nr:tRNA dihydrouridine synthase DusB [Clostridiales bacterium]